MVAVVLGMAALLAAELLIVIVLFILPRRRLRRSGRVPRVNIDSDTLNEMDADSRTKVRDTNPSLGFLSNMRTTTDPKLKKEFADAIHMISKYSEHEDCVWINAILARMICQWYDSISLRERISSKLNREIADITGTYLGALLLDDQLELEELILPIEPPSAKNVSIHGAGQSESFVRLKLNVRCSYHDYSNLYLVCHIRFEVGICHQDFD